MAGSNISKISEGYQVQGFVVGNADMMKKQEEAQAVFATMFGQVNLNVEQQDVMSSNEFAVSDSASKIDSVNDITEETASQDYVTGKDTNDIKKAPDTHEAVKEKTETYVEEVEENIQEVIQEELSVTDEELNQVLEELGLELIDLLNPANLVQVAAKLTGTEGTDALLISEEFVNVMQALGGMSKELAKELGVTEEELQQIIAELSEEVTQMKNVVVEHTEPVQQEAVAEADMQQKDVVEADDEVVQILKKEQSGETVENVTTEDVTDSQVTVAERQGNGDASSETSEDSQESQMKQDVSSTVENKKSEHTLFETGVSHNVNVEQTVEANVSSPVTPYTGTVNVAEVLNQIAEFVKVSVTQNASSLEMQLNPENLGKVYLQLSATSEGNITARLAVQNEVVREALEMQLVDLRQALNQQGVKVDAIEVTVATHEFEKNLEQNAQGEKRQAEQEEKQNGRRNLNLNQLDELSGLMSEEEMLVAKIMRENGNSMDVTA